MAGGQVGGYGNGKELRELGNPLCLASHRTHNEGDGIRSPLGSCMVEGMHTMNSVHGSCFSHAFNGTVHGIISFCINMKTAKYIMKMNTFNDTHVLYH